MEKCGVRPHRTIGFAEGMAILTTVLEPVVGIKVTRAAIQKAFKESGAGGNWREFVTRLSVTIQAVGGAAAGQLAGRAGMAIEV